MPLSSRKGMYFIICINSRGRSLGEPFKTACSNVALLFRISFITFPRHSACAILISVIRVCSLISTWFIQDAISDGVLGFLRNVLFCAMCKTLFSGSVLVLESNKFFSVG